MSGGSVKHTGDKPYIANARFTDEIEFYLPKNNAFFKPEFKNKFELRNSMHFNTVYKVNCVKGEYD